MTSYPPSAAGSRHAGLSPLRIASLLLAVAAFLPAGGAAQSVSGIVVEEGVGTPVAGAMVLLVDSSGTEADRALTDAAGRFVLNAGTRGLLHIEVERIGYLDWIGEPFRATGLDTRLTIEVPIEAESLEGIVVSAERRCRAMPEGGPATARVWEEARKALAAEVYTRTTGSYLYRLRRYERSLDRDARNVLSEKVTSSGRLRAAFTSFPIEQLTTRGFVQRADDTMRVHYAPDAEALLSDAFLNSHCFGLREGEGGRIGLAFEPLPGAGRSDIEGVLWLDAATSELERLDFLYRYGFHEREVGKPGGEVAFTRLPNGAWIVRRWAIRMPNLELVSRGRIRRLGYREESGVTWAIMNVAGGTILHAEYASISAVVTDSAGTGPPPVPVVVEVPGTGVQAVTADDGSVILSGLEEGRHRLAVRHPLLAEWGVASPAVPAVDGRLGEMGHARLRVPTVADVLNASCGGAPRPPGTAAVLGRIAGGGVAMEGMSVVVSWPGASGYTPPAVAAPAGPEGTHDRIWVIGRDGAFVTATTTTGRRGLFLLCDVPHGSHLRVAVTDPANGEPVLTEDLSVGAETQAVVETLIVPVGDGAGGRQGRHAGTAPRRNQ